MWDLLRDFLVFNFSWLQGIFDRIDQILAFWTFLTIGLVTGGFLVVTMAIGEVSELFEDFFGGDHDFGVDHDVSHDGHDGGHDTHDSHDTGEMNVPSVFSFRIVLAFLSGFGIAGAIAIHLDQGILLSGFYGVVTGFGMGILNYLFVCFLAAGQASFNVSETDFVGKEGRVIVDIPAEGLGQIQIDTGMGTITKLSSSIENVYIPENSMVRVEKIVGQTVLVRRTL